ncbi:MAG TPA: cell division protein FtsB [Burkholderiaceae bacterium]|nr:cell division protein FtsB [Burkholderiaceae bacterium]
MRLLVAVLAVLLIGIQWPLWFGKGGWLRVAELQRQIERQQAENAQIVARNAELAAELQSLRAGREAIEERARMQLNMIRDDELFFQLVAPTEPKTAAAPAQPR